MGGPTRRVVAIDGPSGSGKSTVARGVARVLGWHYVDTGATYRAATLAVLRDGLDLDDVAAVGALVDALCDAERLVLLTRPDVPDGARVRLDGQDVSAEIRGAAVTAAVSAVSAVPQVRARLVAYQRGLVDVAVAAGSGAVLEGRDITTVVEPEALVKVYLDASPEARARRRAADADAGVAVAAEGSTSRGNEHVAPLTDAVLADLHRRDAFDSSRTHSPLTRAADAVHVDASDLSAQQVTDLVLALVAEAGQPVPAGRDLPLP